MYEGLCFNHNSVKILRNIQETSVGGLIEYIVTGHCLVGKGAEGGGYQIEDLTTSVARISGDQVAPTSAK